MAQNKVVKIDQKSKESPKTLISPVDELALRTAKEIVIKFIEMGRCSPATFEEIFTQTFKVIREVLNNK